MGCVGFIADLVGVTAQVVSLSNDAFGINFTLTVRHSGKVFTCTSSNFGTGRPIVDTAGHGFFFLVPSRMSGTRQAGTNIFTACGTGLCTFMGKTRRPALLGYVVGCVGLNYSGGMRVGKFAGAVSTTVCSFPGTVGGVTKCATIELSLAIAVGRGVFTDRNFVGVGRYYCQYPYSFAPAGLVFGM